MDDFVSCILPTYDRPEFFRQALRCYLRQTWEQSELLVVDDGDRSVEHLCQGLLRVRYIRLSRRTCLGEKLNIGIDQATGNLIQKLDDDDYYHPAFLKHGVHAMRSSLTIGIVAWDCFQILLAGADRVRFSGHGWAAGGTLLFQRALWDRTKFREIPRAVDEGFLQDHPGALKKVCAPHLYMLVRHGANTWKSMRGNAVDAFFRRLPVGTRLLDVVEPLDQEFYRSLLPRESN